MIIENIGAPLTLVLHHPHFFDASYWSGWSERTGFNVVAFDAPHHGGNDKDQTYQEFAADCVAEVRKAFSTPIIAAGVSQGGVIAQESASEEGIAGVVGISTTRDRAADGEVAFMNQLLDQWGADGPGEDLAQTIAQTATNGEEPALAVTAQKVSEFPARRLRRSVPLLLNRRSDIDLPVPSHFIHGTADQTYDIADLETHDVSITPIEGGSHSATLQTPDVVAAHIRSFAFSLFPELG